LDDGSGGEEGGLEERERERERNRRRKEVGRDGKAGEK
jgi:hypothetical protein